LEFVFSSTGNIIGIAGEFHGSVNQRGHQRLHQISLVGIPLEHLLITVVEMMRLDLDNPTRSI
jgi:hypothetical protein